MLRETPKYEAEKALIAQTEPSVESREVVMEMTTAIDQLGLLAVQDEKARGLLKTIVLEPKPDIHTGFVRERAFFALREADVTAANVALKSLKRDDELRERILHRQP